MPAGTQPVVGGAARTVRLAVAAGPAAGGRAEGGDPPAAPGWVRAGGRMLDSHGRVVRDLRLSVTDRCNFRCVYCMDPGVTFAPRHEVLTAGELVRVARVAAGLGVRKVRITGGEPTLHAGLNGIIAGVRAAGVEVALITNGWSLVDEDLAAWRRAGLARVTVSLDSLRPEVFAGVTRSTVTPERVLAGVDRCVREGLTPVKINAVLVRGVNDGEAADLAGLARRPGWGAAVEVRFIEYMPLDSGRAWDPSRWVRAAETRAAVEAHHALAACGDDEVSATARTYAFRDGVGGRVGFIAPLSSPFCGACSRLRVTADGKVRPCLFSRVEWDLRRVLRSGAGDARVAEFLIDAAWSKQAGHGVHAEGFEQPGRAMSAIGG